MISQLSPDSPMAFFHHHYHARKAQFKPVIDPSLSRQNRIKTNFQIRKNKRSALMSLKRFKHAESDMSSVIESNDSYYKVMEVEIIHNEEDTICSEWNKLTVQRIRDLQDDDPYVILAATRGLRKSILKEARLPFIQALHSSSGVVEALVRLLRHSDSLILQESLWILTNIVSEEFLQDSVAEAIRFGVMNDLKTLLRHKKSCVRNGAVLLFGNMAGDSLPTRNLFLADSQLSQLLMDIMSSTHDQETIDILAFAVYNLFRDHDGQFPSFEHSKVLLPLLTFITNHSEWYSDVNISEPGALVYACASLESFTQAHDDHSNRIQSLLDYDIMNDINALLNHVCEDVVSYAAAILENLTHQCSVDQITTILESGVIHHVELQLTHNSNDVRKHLCTFVSNIAMAGSNMICLLMNHNHAILAAVIHVARVDVYSVRIQALRALIQICRNKELSFGQVEYLVRLGILDTLASALSYEMDISILLGSMDALSCVLFYGNMSSMNFFKRIFEECDGMDKLESMQFHKNSEVFAKVSMFLEKYFLEENDIGNNEEMEDNLTFRLEDNLGDCTNFAFAS